MEKVKDPQKIDNFFGSGEWLMTIPLEVSGLEGEISDNFDNVLCELIEKKENIDLETITDSVVDSYTYDDPISVKITQYDELRTVKVYNIKGNLFENSEGTNFFEQYNFIVNEIKYS